MLLLWCAGCGGAAPLMHPAHPLKEDELTIGGGFSGTVSLAPSELADEPVPEQLVEQGAVAPGLAPWVGGRLGLGNNLDAGLTYTARAIRLDGRRAWTFGTNDAMALSLGLGASGLLPKRQDDIGLRIGGFGGDVPLLFGYMSEADIYGAWLGARFGAEYIRGQHQLEQDPFNPSELVNEDIEGWHAHVGGLGGLRIGFRHVFAVLELSTTMHWAKADVGDVEVTVDQLAIAPSGAFIVRF